MKRLLLSLLCGVTLSSLHANAVEWPGEAIRSELGLPEKAPSQWEAIPFNSEPIEGTHIRSLAALHVGGQRIVVRVLFNQPPDFSADELRINLDLDNQRDTGEAVNSRPGTDVFISIRDQQRSARFYPPVAVEGETQVRALQDGAALYLMVDSPQISIAPKGRVYFRFRTSGNPDQFVAGPAYHLPVADAEPPKLPSNQTTLISPFSSFRFVSPSAGPLNPAVPMTGRKRGLALEKLSNKGLKGSEITPENPIVFGRPTPLPKFHSGTQEASKQQGEITVSIKEEAGVERRNGRVSFGFPLPEGAVWNPDELVVLSGEEEKAIAAQPTVLWGDGSIRWALIDFSDSFSPNENRLYTVRYGKGTGAEKPTLRFEEMENHFAVDTGKLKASIPKTHGALLEGIKVKGQEGSIALPEGVVLEDEAGVRFTTRHAKLTRATVEERSPSKVTIRLEGDYTSESGAKWMSFVSRLTFQAGDARVDIAHTHLNKELKNEFSDFRFLSLPFKLSNAAGKIQMVKGDGDVVTGDRSITYLQQTEASSTISSGNEKGASSGRAPGVFALENDQLKFSGGIVDSWQRWPKAISVENETVQIDLLPPFAKEFEETLPPHLRYPFCEGFYRLKWGMTFTERLILDFSGEATSKEIAAEAQKPLVAVVPAEWYVQTGAFGDIALGDGPMHKFWDDFFEKSFRAHLGRRDQQREYGFLNYGDWFGERARNWGNNEYDTAHAFLSQFCRTGNTDYFRAGIASARHQADVDLVHAYPDPAVIGAQVIHGVGHTGSSSHLVEYGMWSNAMHLAARVINGHSWAEGMVEAWYLTADAPIMEAALKMGENATFVAAPTFKMVAASPRYGGWALRAIMALHHATRDPLYLEAATKIARESTKEQHPGGGWFWLVPNRQGIYHRLVKDEEKSPGMTVFQSGIMLCGWKEYHRVTRDPEVEPAMKAAAGLLYRSWKANDGWPYVIDPEGKAHPFRPDVLASTNGYVADGFIYVGKELLNDDSYQEIAMEAFHRQLRDHEILAVGQRIGYTLRGGNNILSQYTLSKEK